MSATGSWSTSRGDGGPALGRGAGRTAPRPPARRGQGAVGGGASARGLPVRRPRLLRGGRRDEPGQHPASRRSRSASSEAFNELRTRRSRSASAPSTTSWWSARRRWSIVPRLAAYFDEPYADSSAIPSWYLAQMAGEHVVVALNGDGGDEVLRPATRATRGYLAAGDASDSAAGRAGHAAGRHRFSAHSAAGHRCASSAPDSPCWGSASRRAVMHASCPTSVRRRSRAVHRRLRRARRRARHLRTRARGLAAVRRHRPGQPAAGHRHPHLPSRGPAAQGRHHHDVGEPGGPQPLPRPAARRVGRRGGR